MDLQKLDLRDGFESPNVGPGHPILLSCDVQVTQFNITLNSSSFGLFLPNAGIAGTFYSTMPGWDLGLEKQNTNSDPQTL